MTDDAKQRLDAALPSLETAARLEPRLRQAYFHLARAYRYADQPDKAAKQLEEILGI